MEKEQQIEEKRKPPVNGAFAVHLYRLQRTFFWGFHVAEEGTNAKMLRCMDDHSSRLALLLCRMKSAAC
jgi:hypothetical protein